MSAALLVLLCFFPFLVDSSSVVQGFNEKYFEGFADRYLEDHIAQTHHVTTSIDCAFQCMSDSRCQSYNLQMEGTPTYKCDINSKNKTGEPVSLVNRPGFIYFQPVELHSRRTPVLKAFTANFTNLGASGRVGPSSIGDHYRGQGHDGHVMLVSGIQHWRIPCTTRYTIEVVGASGGYDSLPARSFRGYGARMIGTFQLAKGETLKILVGQEGGTNTQSSSGGGGGSFVVRSDNTPLIIAGGGGGRETPQSLKTECHATTSTSGNPGHSGCCTVGWSGGSNGNGANTADSGNSGGGGGGFLTSGRSSTSFGGSYGNGGEGGQGFLQGGGGGRALYNNAHGGFGGGGGAYGNGGGAGGGGGYSGGASGDNISDSCGGGGGSYNTGDQQHNSCCYNDKGHGFVYVTWAC